MNSAHLSSHRNRSIHSVRSTLALLFLLGSVGPLAAADLDAAREDLWEARWRYRHDFVDANGPYSGDHDRLRDNWIAGSFTVRNTLLRARDAFVAATDEPETSQHDPQQARNLLAETIAELLSGHLSHGNFLLIEALKTRYPFLDGANPEPGRPATDTWALKANGSIDAEVREIDKALIEFGIGIKGASAILDRPDIVLDPHTGKGILRAKDPEDFYAGFPSFVPLRDGFRDPLTNYQPQPPAVSPHQAELAQLTAIAERRAQALYEKGAKYFQVSGRKSGENRAEDRRKARTALKVGHHSSYLLGAALGALQSPDDFEANDGPRLNVYTDQMRQLFRNLDDPNFQPFGNTDQFIPPTDKPVAQYIVDARDAAMSAITAEREYREQSRDNNRRQAELEEFFLREDEFLDVLRRVTGFTQNEVENTFGRLRTIDQQRAFRQELEKRVGELLSQQYRPGLIPTVNLGDFGVQILSVQDAQFRIQQAYNTLQNIPRRIQIEEDRSSSVITLIYDANTRVNATEEALAWAGSFSVGASATISLPPAFTASVNFNPLSSIVARLQRERNNIQAHQQAGIEGANSDAAVRTLLLDMDNAVIELDRSKVLFDQENTKLGLLFADVNKIIEDYSEAVALRENNAQLHYANPQYRRWLNDAYGRAEARRREAIVNLYQLGRALAFWWTEDYRNPIFNGTGLPGTSLDRYNAANFPELSSVFSITTANELGDFYLLLRQWDDKLRASRAPTHQLTQTRFYSLRDDILFRGLADAGVSLNRRIRDFRDFLAANAFFAPGSTSTTRPGLRLDFPVSLESLDARQDWNVRVGYLSNYPDGVQAGVRVLIEADAGFNGVEPDAQVDLTYFGVVSTTTYFDDPTLAKRTIVKWELPAPDSPFAENRDELACTIPASINGRTRPNTSYLCVSFRGKPIAATNWRLTIDSTRAINRLVDISKIRDIRLVITETRGRPVDPVTGNAYDFPGL
jgi:hypothetical protein